MLYVFGVIYLYDTVFNLFLFIEPHSSQRKKNQFFHTAECSYSLSKPKCKRINWNDMVTTMLRWNYFHLWYRAYTTLIKNKLLVYNSFKIWLIIVNGGLHEYNNYYKIFMLRYTKQSETKWNNKKQIDVDRNCSCCMQLKTLCFVSFYFIFFTFSWFSPSNITFLLF